MAFRLISVSSRVLPPVLTAEWNRPSKGERTDSASDAMVSDSRTCPRIFGLADNQGVQSAGDFEQVAHGVIVQGFDQARRKSFGGQAVKI